MDWQVVLLPVRFAIDMLVVGVVFIPKLPLSKKRIHLQHVATVESASHPAWMLLAGDFNMATAPRTPLHSALAYHGCLRNVLGLLLAGTATHYTKRGTTDTLPPSTMYSGRAPW